MQHNLPPKNKSHILRTTEEAKRKSRHKLMGSIFLLLIALIILLNVTSKVKPIPVNPKTIEIQNIDTTKTIIKEPAKATIHQTDRSSEPLTFKNTSSEIITNNDWPKATIISKNSTDNNKINTPKSGGKLSFTPRVVTEAVKLNPTPEQILNGDIPSAKSTKYYIQLVASSNKDKINQLQHELNNQGVKTFTQEIKTATGIRIYRLRMGPFNNKDEATQKMSSIKN
ncbi:MAG: SPOR domain-containing protein [Burkholderiales bacterium]|nr:SPOR domain-containing protein [Burkholderiales bacterium]